METTTKQEPSVIERLAKFNLLIQCSPPSGEVDEDWPHIAYAVTITRNGNALWTGPYKLGVGHVKIPTITQGLPCIKGGVQFTQDELYTWNALKVKPNANIQPKALQASLCAKLAVVQNVSPTLQDVLHSLLMDSSAMDETFSDWCANFGYDDDSIKALETYQACAKIGQALSKSFTPSELQELREIFQDY